MNTAWLAYRAARAQFAIAALAALLQRSPAIQVFQHFERAFAQPLARVVQSVSVSAAALGVFHARAGATTFSTMPQTPIAAEVGEEFLASFTVTGTPANPARWTIVDGGLPPGLTLESTTGNKLDGNEVNGQIIKVLGTPTEPGTFVFNVRAFSAAGETDNGRYEVQINVAESVPEIVFQPESMTVREGDRAQFFMRSSSASGDIEWRRDGVAITGANRSSLVIESVSPSDLGDYQAIVTNSSGTVTTSVAKLTIDNAASARLDNLATRGLVLAGDGVMIPGFTVRGGTKRLLVRAAGPALQQFNVTGVLEDPTLRVVDPAQEDLATNDDWSDQADADAIRSIGGPFAFPDGSRDAAALLELSPGTYTAVTSGVGETTGVALIEVYDLDDLGSSSRLTNLANRGQVGVGADVMIPGLVIGGNRAMTLLVRAVGPRLEDFSVAGFLEDPRLQIFKGAQVFLENDDWEDDDREEVVAATSALGTFALSDGSKDAATVVTLNPGLYTMQASGVGETTGVALVEVYVLE